jgi:hypothetical protein
MIVNYIDGVRGTKGTPREIWDFHKNSSHRPRVQRRYAIRGLK